MADDTERLTTTEAAARLTWLLAHGEALTNRQAACVTGLPCETTRQMLQRMCRVIPLTYNDGLWYVISLDEMRET